MDSALGLLAVIAGAVGAGVLIVYLMCRAVGAARKAKTGAQALGALMLLFSFGAPVDPVREVPTEERRLKRKEGDSGDPEEPDDESND